MRAFYCTSFCNFGHYLDTGRPIGHECYVLPVAALTAERNGDNLTASRILIKWSGKRGQPVKGRKYKEEKQNAKV